VRSVENALQLDIPLNAQYIRNIMMGAHSIHDHIVHFYHLQALDYVDLVSAITKGDPKGAAALGAKLSPWPHNTVAEIKASQDRLKAFVGSGQLGIYGQGYWGHPAMKLPPDVNLLAAHHYLQALHYQRRINMVVSILGSKTPHVQNLTVGGVTNPINPNAPDVLNLERLYYVKTLLDEANDFVKQVLLPDTAAVGALYAGDIATVGKGVTNYLSAPDMPMDTKGTQFYLPGGYIPGADLAKFTAIKNFNDPFFRDNVQESIKHAWYDGDWSKGPFEETTEPKFTDWKESVAEGVKYSWVKSPTFQGKPAQVGPLANVLTMFAAGHEPTKKYATAVLDQASAVLGSKVGLAALHSTLGRVACRSIRAAVMQDSLHVQFDALMANIGKGDLVTCNPPTFPKGEQRGFGFHEAPRGILSHWCVIQDGKLKNYQAVVPSTWNSCPRNSQDARGPYEESLIGISVADTEKPLEILRTIHSFDPCLACAIHLVDKDKNKTIKVKVL
jgi:hydrogenase large subunit